MRAAEFGARVVAWANRTGLLLGLYVLLVVTSGSTVAALEGWPWGDGLWWAVTTTTTTGYGDLSPVTVPGRVVAGLTMLAGIVAIGITVGRIAANVIRTRDDWTHEEQEASRQREEAMLAELIGLREARGRFTDCILGREPGDVTTGTLTGHTITADLTVLAPPDAWLTQRQRRMGWRTFGTMYLPYVGDRILLRSAVQAPEAGAIRATVKSMDLARPSVRVLTHDGCGLTVGGHEWAWRADSSTPPHHREDHHGMNTSTGKRIRTAIVTLTLAGAANGFLAACGTEGEDEEQAVYCVNQQNEVVDPDQCEGADVSGGGGDSGGFFFFVGSFGGNSYRPGQAIPSQYTSGSGAATRVDPSSASARASAGLPRTGPIASGTRVSGGIGSGAVGSGS